MPLDTPLDPRSPRRFAKRSAPARRLLGGALRAGNAFAIGAVIRVAHSFLAREVFVVGDGDWYPKASMGMHKYETVVPRARCRGLFRAAAGRPVWAVEKDQARRSCHGGRARFRRGSCSSSAASGSVCRRRCVRGPTRSGHPDLRGEPLAPGGRGGGHRDERVGAPGVPPGAVV